MDYMNKNMDKGTIYESHSYKEEDSVNIIKNDLNKIKTQDQNKILSESDNGMSLDLKGTNIESGDNDILLSESNKEKFKIEASESEEQIITSVSKQNVSLMNKLNEEKDVQSGSKVHETFEEAKASLYNEKSKSDSSLMRSIKERLNEIFNPDGVSLLEKEVPTDAKEYMIQMAAINKKYAAAVEAMKKYIKNRNPWFEPGKERLKRVKYLLEITQKDMNFFASGASDTKMLQRLRETNEGRAVTWGDLLRRARGISVNFENTSAGMSGQTRKYKIGNKNYYYKKDSYVQYGDPEEYLDNLFKNKNEDPLISTVKDHINHYIKLWDSIAANITARMKKDAKDIYKRHIKGLFLYPHGSMSYQQCYDFLSQIRRAFPKNEWQRLNNLTSRAIPKDKTIPIDAVNEFRMKYSDSYSLESIARSHRIEAGKYLDIRNVATYRMAKLLGIEDVVMTAKPCIIADGEEKGISMEDVGGEPFDEFTEKFDDASIVFSQKAGMDVVKLMLLDILCCQTDRHAGNFFVNYQKKGKKVIVTKVIGIDNDLSFSAHKLGDEKAPSMKNPTINRSRNGKNVCIFDYMDAALYHSVMDLDMITVKAVLADCGISEKEFAAFEDRLNAVKNSLHKQYNSRPDFLINGVEDMPENSSLTTLMPHLKGSKAKVLEVDGFVYDIMQGTGGLVAKKKLEKI